MPLQLSFEPLTDEDLIDDVLDDTQENSYEDNYFNETEQDETDESYRAESDEDFVDNEDEGEGTAFVSTRSTRSNREISSVKPQRRSKGSFSKTISSDISVRERILASYAQPGSSIALVSNEFMVTPVAVRDFLSSQNVLRPRGRGITNTRVKTTNPVTPEMIVEAKERYLKGTGVVALAKEYNVSSVELSSALKNVGIVITRGRPKKI